MVRPRVDSGSEVSRASDENINAGEDRVGVSLGFPVCWLSGESEARAGDLREEADAKD